ncbi:MAG: flagellar protein FlaG [Defluviitaleaceae bacterium]|nr:flagellar protein FlaG [Defluviitaleaceae bacterium]
MEVNNSLVFNATVGQPPQVSPRAVNPPAQQPSRPVQQIERAEPAPVQVQTPAPAPAPAPSPVDFEFRAEGERSERLPQNEIEATDVMISRAIDDANRQLAVSNFHLSYGIHEPTNMVMVRVYDSESQEVIREIPPESRLDVVAKIRELAGIMLDNVI